VAGSLVVAIGAASSTEAAGAFTPMAGATTIHVGAAAESDAATSVTAVVGGAYEGRAVIVAAPRSTPARAGFTAAIPVQPYPRLPRAPHSNAAHAAASRAARARST
jgi:hypothetical protein